MAKATKKAISARVNRAAWDWLEMQCVNKNKLLDRLITGFVYFLQHNDNALRIIKMDDNNPNFDADPLTLYKQYNKRITP